MTVEPSLAYWPAALNKKISQRRSNACSSAGGRKVGATSLVWPLTGKRIGIDNVSEQTDAKVALLSLLKKMGLQAGVPISLNMIRPPLISQGISQDRIVFALYELREEAVIDLLTDNRLVLMKSI
jgi:hypothetical protein